MKAPVPPAQEPFIRTSMPAGQKEDLGILAAQLDDNVRARCQTVGRHPGSEHLLHKGSLYALRHAHAGRAGDGKHRLPAAALRHPP